MFEMIFTDFRLGNTFPNCDACMLLSMFIQIVLIWFIHLYKYHSVWPMKSFLNSGLNILRSHFSYWSQYGFTGTCTQHVADLFILIKTKYKLHLMDVSGFHLVANSAFVLDIKYYGWPTHMRSGTIWCL